MDSGLISILALIMLVSVVLTIIFIFLYFKKSKELQFKIIDYEKQISENNIKSNDTIKNLENDNKNLENKNKEFQLEIENNNRFLEQKKKEAEIEAKESFYREKQEIYREKEEAEKEIKFKEKKLMQKEDSLDKKLLEVENKKNKYDELEKEINNKSTEIDGLIESHKTELERISQLNENEAREILLDKIENKLKNEYVQRIKFYEDKIKNDQDKIARKVLSQAIQRCAVDHVVESTVSVVTLPSDDLKGKIIGREGRNIRTFENLTGIDLIIDDTPEAVVISGFDPVRREIARISLEYLVSDGRIHPTRIEEVVEKARTEVATKIMEAGEKTVFEVGIQNIHPEIVKTIGKLQYRTSYGQNILQHSKEVSYLAGLMAAQLGVNVKLAKRAGLLHDLGKALTHEEEGTHTVLGVELARKYNESPKVLHAIACHHHDIEFETVEAVLVQVADALSAARPGARMEQVENYIKRMENLEKIGNSFEGVDKCYVLQAGREIRIMVKPEYVNDDTAILLAKNIAEKIETEMEYPGQIKITVIRETRASNFAK